jgi:ribonuclease P protein component
VTVTFLAEASGPPRVAYAVGRRVGGAVARNRLRRRLRAIAADQAPALPPGAYLVAAGPEAASLPHARLHELVSGAMAEASK